MHRPSYTPGHGNSFSPEHALHVLMVEVQDVLRGRLVVSRGGGVEVLTLASMIKLAWGMTTLRLYGRK